MARPRNILEKYVTFEENDYWKCNYCPQKSNGRPNRIIAHLTGKEKQGIKICPGLAPEEMEKIDKEVKTVEQQRGEKDDTRHKKGNKKRKCASGSGTSGSDPTEAEETPASPGKKHQGSASQITHMNIQDPETKLELRIRIEKRSQNMETGDTHTHTHQSDLALLESISRFLLNDSDVSLSDPPRCPCETGAPGFCRSSSLSSLTPCSPVELPFNENDSQDLAVYRILCDAVTVGQ